MKPLFICVMSFCAFLLTSCGQDSVVAEVNAEAAEDVCAYVVPFESEDGSRVNVTVNSSGAQFAWSSTDKIGCFSKEGGLLRFDILTSDADANTAHFKGAGFSLDKNTEYCAFYPFNDAAATANAIPVTFAGQKQIGDNNTDHIGAYDYLSSVFQATNARGEIIFPMKHMASLVQFKLTMPDADTYTQLKLHGHYGCRFIEKGYYDLSIADPAVAGTVKPNEFTVELENISTTAAGQEITVYAMMGPYDYSSQWWQFEVIGSLRTYQSGMEYGRKFEAGKIHGIKRTLY